MFIMSPPILKTAIDQVSDNNVPLSEINAKELYRSHVAETEEVTAWELRQSEVAMLVELSQSLKDTRLETTNFKETMNTCVDDLSKVEKEGLSLEKVMALILSLVKKNQTSGEIPAALVQP
jgi:diguanylate cyclase